MSKPIKLAVFDLDGTLVDSVGHIARAVTETARILNIPAPAPEAIPRVIGLSLDMALATLFPGHDAKTYAEADRVYRKLFSDWREQSGHVETLFDGTHPALDALERAGYLLGIATGKGRKGVDFLLNHHGLVGRFVTIQTPDVAPGKPDPGMLFQAMSETGAAPDKTVMIGDTVYDIGMALSAKTHALGVSWGNHPASELTEFGAHKIVDRMDEVLHAMEQLTSRS
ncbi:MAG: HAD-IA family hydrolase [Rhodospirillaceae bacterium]|nr:HAD-IA family hydrolase [Rhodospirillaceae bacterium]